MDEYSDSEDEGDDRRNEKSYRDTKRPRLIEDSSKNGVARSSGTTSQLLSSPLPPEPSPITPLPQDESSTTESNGMEFVYNYIEHTQLFLRGLSPNCLP